MFRISCIHHQEHHLYIQFFTVFFHVVGVVIIVSFRSLHDVRNMLKTRRIELKTLILKSVYLLVYIT